MLLLSGWVLVLALCGWMARVWLNGLCGVGVGGSWYPLPRNITGVGLELVPPPGGSIWYLVELSPAAASALYGLGHATSAFWHGGEWQG
jgi:hypothetical protein